MRYRIYYFNRGNLILYNSNPYGICGLYDTLETAKTDFGRACSLDNYQFILVDVDENDILGFGVRKDVCLA